MDMLLSAGEQISISLLAMAIAKLGYPAVSLLGWQAGFETDSKHSLARIKRVNAERIRNELDKKNIVVVAGFQGLDKHDNITTLGRGGSDTSAVAIASSMRADLCQIYTDVDGVYTADPRKVKGAKKMDEITYDEMLELATLGAQVLNNRSVEMAKKYNIELEVCSSLENKPGTIVKEAVKMEKMLVKGVACDKDILVVSIVGLKDTPGIAFKVFNQLARKNVNIDIILQSVGRNNTKDITFTVPKNQEAETLEAIEAIKPTVEFEKVVVNDKIGKVSIVGAGMETHPGVASKMFEALADVGINIHMISTSEIKISVLVDVNDCEKAVQVVHDAFI
jgi:aspartate kinase